MTDLPHLNAEARAFINNMGTATVTDTNPSTDPRYAWWRSALAGANPEALVDEPQCGFYSMGRGAERRPVAIFEDGGIMYATVGWNHDDGEEDRAMELWPSIHSHPISEDVYWDTVDNRRWADLEGIVAKPKDDEDAVTIGHNAPPETTPFEEISEEVEAALGVLRAAIPKDPENPKKPGKVRDQATADKIANARDRLQELLKKADAQRDKEKRPHDEASKAVQALWRPITDPKEGKIAIARKWASAIIAEFIDYENTRRTEEAEQEAERIRLENERRAEEHATKVAQAAEAGEEPPPEPEPVEEVAPAPVEPVRVGGGYSGRRTGERTTYRAVVENWDLLIDSLKGDEKLRELAQSLADSAARSAAHVALPGCRVVTEKGTT